MAEGEVARQRDAELAVQRRRQTEEASQAARRRRELAEHEVEEAAERLRAADTPYTRRNYTTDSLQQTAYETRRNCSVRQTV